MSTQLLYQGAEARLYLSTYLTVPAVIKERLSKKYRVPELDVKLNKQRLLQEARCMVKCRRAGVRTPCLYLVDTENYRFYMERILGETVRNHLNASDSMTNQVIEEIATKIGVAIGKMHDAEVVHGDLTTSNLMLQYNSSGDLEIVIIDFGLASMKPVIEDMAVDLYVLERAFISTHPGSEQLVSKMLDSYRFSCRKGTLTLTKLEQVRQRGRKREMFG